MASANWLTRCTEAPSSTASASASSKTTTYSSLRLAVRVFVSRTPAAFGEITATRNPR